MEDESDDDSFKSVQDGEDSEVEGLSYDGDRFSPNKEATLLAESNDHKAVANQLFGKACYSDAIQTYDKALASCPAYLDYEIAILRSNIAACHIKLQEWKEAVASATSSLDCLERLDPTPKQQDQNGRKDTLEGKDASESVVEEVDDTTAERIEALNKSGRSHEEIQKIRIKSLLRRAKARSEVGGWASLQGAAEDYQQLSSMRDLSTLDRNSVNMAKRTLPPRLEEAKQREMGEMMGKLKDLGNGILKPFGLSTDNFQFTKDENSGGYSMQFKQGEGKTNAK